MVNEMPLTFDGVEYRTVSDVIKHFKTSAKMLKKLIANEALPAPEKVVRGARPFRHYDDEWMKAAEEYFRNLRK